MEAQKVIISQDLEQSLSQAIAECTYDRLFVLTDETTHRLCLPVVAGYSCMKPAERITIGATDANKTLESLSHVWSELQRLGATRHSLMVNLGGGMVTDLGGFAASTFKRGISYINIPTTLLSMVDASVGGKTGINFGGLKNEIGVFNNARSVILDTVFLKTMDEENLLSGYAEMLKHGLISNEPMWAELMRFSPLTSNLQPLAKMVADSVAVTQRIVLEDPEPRTHRRPCLRVAGAGAQARAARICCGVGTDSRAVAVVREDGIPPGQDAADGVVHPGALRPHDHHV